MIVKTVYKGHTLELKRSLGGISFIVNGETRQMVGGKMFNHKVDQHFSAKIEDESGIETDVRAELKLGWLVDKVFFYYQSQLIAEKKLL